MLKIAVVDDDATFRKQAQEYIEKYFHQDSNAFTVRSYQDGFSFLSEYEGDYDIAMIDIMMPG